MAAITPGMTPIVPDVEEDGEWLEQEADWLEEDEDEEGAGWEDGEEDEEEEPPITDHLQVSQDVSLVSACWRRWSSNDRENNANFGENRPFHLKSSSIPIRSHSLCQPSTTPNPRCLVVLAVCWLLIKVQALTV